MNMKNKIREFFTLTRKGKGGFTLVELIVVIAILGILAGVAIPVYNGYIKKADRAGDEQLLAAINKAFTSAVLAEGDDIGEIDSATLNIKSDKTLDTASLTPEDYKATFAEFYQGNETAKFKTYIRLVYDASTHSFKGVAGDGSGASAAYNQVLDSLLGEDNAENLQKLVSSIWGEMGAGDLTGKVDWTADIANKMLETNSSGSFSDLITNCGGAMMEFMGITDEQEQVVKTQELAIAKMNQLIAQNPEKYAGLDAEAIFNKALDTEGERPNAIEQALFNEAQNSIAVNNAILTAAQNSQSAATNIKEILGNSDSTSKLIASVNKGVSDEDTSAAMGEVALAYAMYMSYAEREGIEVENAQQVLDGLNDEGFKAYVNDEDNSGNFDKDMQGYLASMDMINNSVQGNEDAVTDVVLNGFGNSDLVSVLNQAMSSAKADD